MQQKTAEREESFIPRAAAPSLSVEEMVNAGFHTCVCATNNRICVSAIKIHYGGDQSPALLDCKKCGEKISPEGALRCLRTCLVSVTLKPN